MSKTNKDSELFEDVMADLQVLRELSLENAKDVLEESWTPRLERMLSDQLQAESEKDGSDDEDSDDEIELDLGGEDEEETDDDDMDELSERELDEITNFLSQFNEEVSTDGRHSDPDLSDELSYALRQHDGGHENAPMLDMSGHEDGHTPVPDSGVHEDLSEVLAELEEGVEEFNLEEEIDSFLSELNGGDFDLTESEIDAILSEYGVTDVDRDPMYDQMAASDPFGAEFDLMDFESDSYTEFNPDAADHDLEESVLNSLLHEMDYEDDMYDDDMYEMDYEDDPMYDDDMYEMGYDDDDMYDDPMYEMDYDDDPMYDDPMYEMDDDDPYEEVAKLKEKLNQYRKAIGILRNQVNEVNLLNSKLLYNNKLNENFNLNTRQQKRVLSSFDRAKNLREVKLTYANFAQNLHESTSKKTKKNSSTNMKVNRITESLEKEMGSQKDNSTRPPSHILNENVDTRSRMMKLGGVEKNERKRRRK